MEIVLEKGNIYSCERCGLKYDWRKSPSTLKMTYCGSLCEKGALGFTMDSLRYIQRKEIEP